MRNGVRRAYAGRSRRQSVVTIADSGHGERKGPDVDVILSVRQSGRYAASIGATEVTDRHRRRFGRAGVD